METLKFLFTTTFYPPYHIGGDAVHVKYLAEELAMRGHEVHVLHSLDAYRIKRKNLPKKVETDGVYIHVIDTRFSLSPYVVYLLGGSSVILRKFQELIREIKPDIVHHHNISLLGYSLLKKQGNYLNLYTAHDYWLICQQNNLMRTRTEICDGSRFCALCALRRRRPPQLWRYSKGFKTAVNDVDLLISPSNYLREKILKSFNVKVVTIPNFTPEPPRDIKPSGFSNFFLYAGVLEEHKGVLNLIKAYEDISEEVEAKLIIVGDDFVSKLMKRVYKDVLIEEFPSWLRNQSRFPAEVFEYQVEMYNYYHIDDPATFIQAKEFYEIPEGVTTYFVIARYPGFERPEFLGILSLQLQGSMGRNLAGFMIVRNDYPHLGEKIFYKVPIGSEIKLLGPSAAREALERDAEFRKLRTLLENPRIGDILLYHIGGRLVYVIPVYTSPAGGVVAQLGTIAIVGAEFTGKYYIGLGRSLEESYRSFLRSLEEIPPFPKLDAYNLTIEILGRLGVKVAQPERMNPNLIFREGDYSVESMEELREVLKAFTDEWIRARGLDRALIWLEDDKVYVGSMFSEKGVVELHYITISVKP